MARNNGRLQIQRFPSFPRKLDANRQTGQHQKTRTSTENPAAARTDRGPAQGQTARHRPSARFHARAAIGRQHAPADKQEAPQCGASSLRRCRKLLSAMSGNVSGVDVLSFLRCPELSHQERRPAPAHDACPWRPLGVSLVRPSRRCARRVGATTQATTRLTQNHCRARQQVSAHRMAGTGQRTAVPTRPGFCPKLINRFTNHRVRLHWRNQGQTPRESLSLRTRCKTGWVCRHSGLPISPWREATRFTKTPNVCP